MTNACKHCERSKDEGGFSILRGCVNQSNTCDECIKAQTAERNRIYRIRHADEINARARARREAKRGGRP